MFRKLIIKSILENEYYNSNGKQFIHYGQKNDFEIGKQCKYFPVAKIK